MRNFKFITILSILFLIYIFLCAFSYVSAISDNLSESVFRLHVIANSDNNEDQNLKYIVRDNLIKYINNSCNNFSEKKDVIEFCISHKNKLCEIAQNTIYENGFSYPVSIEIGNFNFPTKKYGDITFPQGYYDGLKVKIGSASGQNWWCVMFPPLCFINPTTSIVPDDSKDILEENLSDESFKIISDNKSSSTKFKFKIIEFFEKTGFLTAQNT